MIRRLPNKGNTLYHYVLLLLCPFLLGRCQDESKLRPDAESVSAYDNTKQAKIDAARKPIMLDDIHYYTLNREASNIFFEQNFNSAAMLEESPNPFKFIDFQLIKSGQSTVNISEQGPFPGIKVGDPKRWERTLMKPSATNPPRYGVHWLAFTSGDLDATQDTLRKYDVQIVDDNFKMPHDGSKALLCFGPDYNLIVIKESDAQDQKAYAIDHLLLLVKDMKANVDFFKDVFAGQVIKSQGGYTIMDVADHTFVLASPRSIGIDPTIVLNRDPTVFKPDIDHLGFLYEDLTPAYEYAVSKGYEFLSKPVPINYFGRATLYTFAITYSPDGLQCEMFQESGRTGSRQKLKNRNS